MFLYSLRTLRLDSLPLLPLGGGINRLFFPEIPLLVESSSFWVDLRFDFFLLFNSTVVLSKLVNRVFILSKYSVTLNACLLCTFFLCLGKYSLVLLQEVWNCLVCPFPVTVSVIFPNKWRRQSNLYTLSF